MNTLLSSGVRRVVLPLLACCVLLVSLGATAWTDNALNRGIEYTPAERVLPHTGGPHVGVNTYNLHVEPDPAVVRQSLEMAHTMGARYIRLQVPWEDIEIHGRGDFTDRRNLEAVGAISAWAKYDRIVAIADELDLELVMRIDRPPDWARQFVQTLPGWEEGLERDPNSTGPPDDFEDYGRFVERVVARYRGSVQYFQLWNEPNLANEWNWQTPNPQDFVALLRVGALAVKDANPEAFVIFPSLAPVDGLDKRAPISELEYLDAVYRAGGRQFFDIMSAQAYGLGQPPDEHRYVRLTSPREHEWTWTRPIDTRVDVSRIVLLREVMEQHGDAGTPVWISEAGWNSAPESIPPERRYTWGAPVTEEQKGEYLTGYLERARDEWSWVGVSFVWMLRYGGYRPPDPADPTPYFALIERDFTPLPAYAALRDYTSRPQFAGVGTHSVQHVAVTPQRDGWDVRFQGQHLTLVGDFAPDVQATLNDAPVELRRSQQAGQTRLTTPDGLPQGEHTLQLRNASDSNLAYFMVGRAPPVPLWVWSALPVLLTALLVASTAALVPPVFAGVRGLLARTPPARLGWRAWLQTPGGARAVFVAQGVALLIFYAVTTDLPTRVVGTLLFGLLAFIRPDLALLYIPMTVPLFFLPKGMWDARFGLDGFRIPLHEVALLTLAAATVARTAADWWRDGRVLRLPAVNVRALPWGLLIPVAIFVLAATVGVLIALPDNRGAALREWRWLVFEPLLFFALLYFIGGRYAPVPGDAPTGHLPSRFPLRVLLAFVAGGGFVGLVGMGQFGGINLVPLIGDKVGFSEDQLFVEGVRRVNSVYGHPNNLGLYTGRVWAVAAVLALAAYLDGRRGLAVGCGLAALFALGGLLVSFSKGALLGAAGAGLVLLFFAWRAWQARSTATGGRRVSSRVLGFGLGFVLVGLPLLIAALLNVPGLERFNPLGETSDIRLKLWASSLAMIADHPLLGVGLDQFLAYYGDYIHPSLVDTNEAFTSHPHNLLLDLWLRLGVLGLLAMLWLVGRYFWRVTRQARSSLLAVGLLAAMVAAVLHGLVDNFYFVPDLAFAFWLLLWVADTSGDG